MTCVAYYRPLGERILTGAAYAAVKLHHPPTLLVPPLPGVTKIVTSNGTLLASFAAQSQDPRHLDQIAPVVVAALLSSEDRTFFTNDGVDARGIARAAVDDLLGHPTQGGSTLTQQYVKNLLIREYGVAYGDASSLSRKIREVAYASEITHLLSKDQILTGYLNTVYFGAGAYGIGAAAERYFSIQPAQLTTDEAALLVALVRSPSVYDPLTNPGQAMIERNIVLTTMVANHDLSQVEEGTLALEPLGLHPSTLSRGCLSSSLPYFCDYLSPQLLTLPELGPTRKARLARLDAGDLTIVSTLNLSLQRDTQRAVDSKLNTNSPIGSAAVMIHPGTGRVLAMASNRVYGLNVAKNETTINYALSVDPVGSTMKIFTLAAALLDGVPLGTILPAGATYHSTVLNNPPGGYFTNSDDYDPSYIDMATGTALSVNTFFVQLEQRVGVLAVAREARALGLPIPTSGPLAPTAREGSFTLGARSFSPLEMAGAYATLAAHGLYCKPTAIASIVFPGHHVVKVPPSCKQVLPATVANTITGLLAGVVTYGTGTAAAVAGHPLVGKTGTTSNFGAAWFDGYTPDLATAVWVGNPLGPSHPLYNIDGVPQVFGGTLPAEEFATAMTPAIAKEPYWNIPAPTDAYLLSAHLTVPSLLGLTLATARARLSLLGLHAVFPPGDPSAVVTSTYPIAGTIVTSGTSVTLTSGTW